MSRINKPANRLLDAPILPTLARLTVPNLAAMVMTSVVTLTETSYIGSLGTTALAGMALAFPMVLLQGMLSGGAMGGGMSSAVSRALGAGNPSRANELAVHATVIGAVIGLLFTLVFLSFGRPIYALLGGTGAALSAPRLCEGGRPPRCRRLSLALAESFSHRS